MDRTENTKPAPPKQGRRFRLVALLSLLVLSMGVYLPLRTSRANDKLLHSILENDAEGVRFALANGADSNLRMNLRDVSEHPVTFVDFVRLLFHRTVSTKANNSKTALMFAVTNGDREIAEALLEHGANVNTRLDNGTTALLSVASKAKPEMLAELLAKGADIHTANRQGDTPLLIAAQNGLTDNVTTLLAKGENVHETNLQKQTALTLAVENRREKIIALLLAAGTDESDLKGARLDPNQNNRVQAFAGGAGFTRTVTVTGGNAAFAGGSTRSPAAGIAVPAGSSVTYTILSGPRPPNTTQAQTALPPLLFAAKYGSPSLLKYLWERTAPADRSQQSGRILSLAVQSGEPETVRFLLAQGVPANPVIPPLPAGYRVLPGVRYDPRKIYTPLHYAAALPNSAIARMLVEHGASVNVEDAFGTTPLLAAVSGGRMETMRLLIEHGANVRAVETNTQQNALMRGVQSLEVARMLLDHGLNVNARDRTGRTALMQCYDPKIAELLLAHGANINARDGQGNTALLSEVKSGQTPIVKLLLQHGADLNVVNSQGETPLAVARSLRVQTMIDVLIAAGAKK